MKPMPLIATLALAVIASLSSCERNDQSQPAEEAATPAANAPLESDLPAAYTTDDETLWLQYYDCVCEAADVMDAATEANIRDQIAKLGAIVVKMQGIRAQFDKLGGALCPGTQEAVDKCTEAKKRAMNRFNDAAKAAQMRELGHSRGRLQDAFGQISAIFSLPVVK